MLWIIPLFIVTAAFAQTAEETALRNRLSEEAATPRLTETVEMATRALTSPAPEVDCDDERKFVLVGVSGFGTGEDGRGQPSGAHDNLPSHENISSTLRITHGTSRRELQSIVDSICKTPTTGQRPGLMIMANSWGAGAATRLSQLYQRTCGEPVELFVMVDGVSKPIGPYRRPPTARRCVNYYQRLSTVRGNSIQGCENHDLSNQCSGGGIATCHIEVEWNGSARGAADVLTTLRK